MSEVDQVVLVGDFPGLVVEVPSAPLAGTLTGPSSFGGTLTSGGLSGALSGPTLGGSVAPAVLTATMSTVTLAGRVDDAC